MTDETWTITVPPEQWLYVSAYEGHSFNNKAERFGIVLTDTSLLPEEIANEVYTNRRGHAPLKGFVRPAVEHHLGWEHLATELRRMDATNRAPDDIFAGQTLEVTFSMVIWRPQPGSKYTSPLVILPVHTIKILPPSEKSA